MRERGREIRYSSVGCRDEVDRIFITAAAEVKSVSPIPVSACRVEGSRPIGSNAVKRNHHVGHRNHSVSSGTHDLACDYLRARENTVTVGACVELLSAGNTDAHGKAQEN
jgi:hypothetical protein